MTVVDLNCDLGEGAGHDAALMPWITSANIACGAHAGDEATMRATAALARTHGVAIGAHPGFADRGHFGRRELALAPDAIRRLVGDQLAVLGRIAEFRHVKPHGALYNLAARDAATAEAIVAAIVACDRTLVLFALAGSELARCGRAAGLRVAQEVFADRTYRRDGTLTPRSDGGALIEDDAAAAAQALRLVREGRVRATDGVDVAVTADTVCLHGDGAHPVEFARRLRHTLKEAGVEVRAITAR